MIFSKTLPTEPGKYYWKRCIDCPVWFVRNLISMGRLGLGENGNLLVNIGGLWGGCVPEPGTTFTVDEIEKYFIGGNFSETADDKFAKLRDPQVGIAVVTRENK